MTVDARTASDTGVLRERLHLFSIPSHYKKGSELLKKHMDVMSSFGSVQLLAGACDVMNGVGRRMREGEQTGKKMLKKKAGGSQG